MPYIGNNHIAGDHTNNFKVLDDISSFTATFDGSATSVVDTTNNTIRVVEHRFIQGQRVTYTNGGGGNIGGLTTGTAYFVIFDSSSTIKLATSASNAASSTAINLSTVGTGSSHTLNAAFDGVNTKFKLTHGSGTGARLNNATQINIAINNVVQRPNLDPNNFTDGFALEDNHKIVFQTAPTSEDIFWGSIIANTLTTFDISDHKIDTFTGDGSTTEFTLSHTPANNESLMVTINGVLQHPSNASTARAYTLIASIIQFTAAPANGDEIQVRHLGFAGATTSDVSGFYGRTGNVVLTANDHITTGDITARNINASGILTASSASFGGNVSIGGTLTYEDVSNIDSVGIITARDGVHVGAGVSAVGVGTFSGLDISGDIDVDGHTNLDNVSIAGVTTTTGNITIDGLHSGGGARMLNIGSGNNILRLYEDTSQAARIFTNGDLILTGATTQIRSKSSSNQLEASFHATNGVKLYHNNNEKLFVNGSGVNITGIVTAATGDFFDLDVDGHANLDHVNVSGTSTITGVLYPQNGIRVPDNRYSYFGTGNDLSIRHDASGGHHSYIFHHGAGAFKLGSDNQMILGETTNRNYIEMNPNSDVKLFFNNAEKLATSNTGITITGTAVATGADINGDLDVDGHTNLDNVSIVGVTTASDNISIVKSSGPILELTTNTNAADATLRLSEGTPGSTTNGGGMFYSGADNKLHITCGTNSTTKRISILRDTGKVGIGTDNPSQMLTVRGTILKTRSDSGLGLIYLQQDGSYNGQIAINQNGGVTRVKLNSNGDSYFTGGKVGIGIDTPDHNLHVFQNAGDSVITIESTGNGNHSALEFLRTTSGGDSKGAGSIYVTGNTSVSEAKMQFGVGHNIGHGQLPRMTIMGNGEVGIGTDNPTTLLHIDDDSADPYLRIGGSGRDCGIQLSANANYTAFRADGANRLFVNAGADSIRFSIGGTTSSNEKLRIDSGGRILIGSTQLLDATAGTIHVDGGTSGGRIALRGTTTSAGGGIGEIFAYWNTNKVAGIIALAGSDTSNKDDGHLTFLTRPDTATGVRERLRIESNGRIKFTEDPIQRNGGAVDNFSGDGAYMQHYVSRDGSTYRRNLDIAAVGDGTWGCAIRFSTNRDGNATSTEKLRILKDIGVHMQTNDTVIMSSGANSNGVGYGERTRIYPYWVSDTGACRFNITFHPSTGVSTPQFWVFTNATNHLTGSVEIGANSRTNSPNNAVQRMHHSKWNVGMYGEGDNDFSGSRWRDSQMTQKGNTIDQSGGYYYIHHSHSEYGTNANQYQNGYGGWYWHLDNGSYWQGQKVIFDMYFTNGGFSTWYAYIDD